VNGTAGSLLSIGAASLWLGLLLGAAGFATVRLLPRLGPSRRYRLWYAALLLTLLVPLATQVTPRRATAIAGDDPRPAAGPSPLSPVGLQPGTPDRITAPGGDDMTSASWGWRLTLPAAVIDFGLWVWLLGAGLGLGGLAVEMGRLSRLRRSSRPPPRELLELWSRAITAVPTGRRLRLLVSDRVGIPMASGWRRPAVIVPVELHRLLPADDVRHLLMHELAHLARFDDWHVAIQHLARALCWWHPVVRWVTRRLETEREFACDELVAKRGDRRGYARALVRVAEVGLDHSSGFAPAALRGRLTDRVEALLGRSAETRWSWRRAGSGLALGAMAMSGLWIGPPAVGAGLVASMAPAQSPQDSGTASPERTRGAVGRSLDSLFRTFADSGFSGTVLVAMGNEIVLEQGYGMADRERRIPATATTRYSTAGITKLFTATAILTLEKEGRLSVGDSLTRWVGPLPRAKDRASLHHLLTHSDGLTRLQAPVYRRSAEAFVSAIAATPAAFEPGSGYRYNDFGHSLLGLVVERASGESYESFIRRRFIEPARLRATGFEPDGGEMAVEYAGPAGAQVPVGPRAYSWGRRGSLGLVSTAGDLYRWFRAMEDATILAPAVRARMLVPRMQSDWGAEQGYGWDLEPRPDGRRIWRRVAGTPGFEGELLHDPLDGWTAVILVNSRIGWRFRVWQAIERTVISSGPNR